MRLYTTSHRTAAFTLMELLISMALLSMVMVIVTMSLDSGTRFNDRFSRQTDINNRANDVLNKLAMQLRMAAAGATPATSLELPGAYPVGFQAKDPSKAANVRAYYFAVSTGLGNALNNWKEQYEPFKRIIIHDYSVIPGRLLLQPRDNVGNLGPLQILSEDVAENGFSLTRVGNTLQMSLTLRSQTRVEEEILYTALAQTLFLRSTLNESSGSSAVTYVDNPEDADGNIVGATTGAPSVLFGNLVTELTTTPPQQQVSLFFTAPIGKRIDPKSIVVALGNSDNTVSSVVDDGATVSVGTATVTRITYPPSDQWPSRNGTYSVTLTGNIPSTVTVNASVANTEGEKSSEAKRYR
jgi:type II secretory pathway pseudopilin PulG